MTRDELLARMTSRELSAWLALVQVEHDEADHQRDLAESGDGMVHVSGLDVDDDEPEDGDGSAD